MVSAILIVLLFDAVPALSQEVSSDVDSVVTGGSWESAGDRGMYRVVVVNAGYEHVHSTARVEWIAEPRSANDATRIVASAEIKFPEPLSVGATLEVVRRNHIRVALAGTSPYTLSHKRWKIDATLPGKVTQ
jgi:hypothetical protein